MNFPSYIVAIRTLGLAGEKFRQELESIYSQTKPPQGIYIYIAEGYSRPEFQIGDEKYITTKKGMISQRILDIDQINTDYILFLDDDVFLPSNSVEKLFEALLRNNGDCIAADVFHPHLATKRDKVYNYITNLSSPTKNNQWAFTIKLNGSFSYNNHPEPKEYLSQSAAGPCSLWKTSVYEAIHFQDEIWLDKLGFAYGDDLLFFYKLYVNNFALLVHYDTGIVHLDAKSARNSYNQDALRLYKRAKIWYILWFRINNNFINKSRIHILRSKMSYIWKFIEGFILHIILALCKLHPIYIWYYIKGNFDGYKYIHSKEYKKIPSFIVHHEHHEDSARHYQPTNRRCRKTYC